MEKPRSALQAAQRRRKYVHFDLPLSKEAVKGLVLNEERVASHPFYPFLRHDIVRPKVKRIGNGGFIRRLKAREIRYAAHSDAAIYGYYGYQLAGMYEQKLARADLGASVISFRSLSKSNVDFAAEAFDWIAGNSPCVALGFDVRDFFGSIQHSILKAAWCDLLDVDKLPGDHFAVYKSITKHSSVELIQVRKALKITRSALKRLDRLCSPEEFRGRVRSCGLIETNKSSKGIPQGSPISAFLSNLYMYEFDLRVASEVAKKRGYYRRYCDDILIVVDEAFADDMDTMVASELKRIGLEMQTSKTQRRSFAPVADKPLQYLGLTFDGERTLLRPSGIARHYSKMRRGVLSHKLSPRFVRGLSLLQVRRRRLLRAYTEHADRKKRTFVNYVRRACKRTGSRAMMGQIRGNRKRFKRLRSD